MVRELAPAKLNLILHVGLPALRKQPARLAAHRGSSGMHPIASLFASLELADELEVTEAAGEVDTVVCPGVEGENLAAVALRAFRDRHARELPPLEVRIRKRIPVAAGLGGGSGDAAAALRAANRIAGERLDADELRALATGLGSDVPSQVDPGHAVVTGTGEIVEPIALPSIDVVLVPDPRGLSAGEVYAELDRREGWRAQLDPAPLRRLAGADADALAGALENDLEPAVVALLPEVRGALIALREAGALGAAVTGSGPTCFGLFGDEAAAVRAAGQIRGAIATRLRSV